jgi:hypothetical protein
MLQNVRKFLPGRRAFQGTKIAAGSSIDQELQRIGKGMTT